MYLGVYVAERALSKFFNDIQKMPMNNPGYDYICGKGFKIDVKSSCLHKYKNNRGQMRWQFTIRRNKIADYFLCLAFDSRESLTPLHVWLIPSSIVSNRTHLDITNTIEILSKWALYERPIDRVVACCQIMKSA